MSEWSILCLRLKNGDVSPLAKTKRDISKKEARRLCRKFSNDEDFSGEWVIPQWRLGLDEIEIKRLPLI